MLTYISLQNFRNYKKFDHRFSKNTTIIVGPNTAGKTNLIEAVMLLSLGKSFKTDKETELIRFGEHITRVKGKTEEAELEIRFASGVYSNRNVPQKKLLVNGVPKRRIDFAGNLTTILFSPADLDLIIGGPSQRRHFLDSILEQVYREYRLALSNYTKALRQRNALLQLAQETGRRNAAQFSYWDEILIREGSIISRLRQEFIDFITTAPKDIFNLTAEYDASSISEERLLQYKDAEVGAGVTLVGPQRDDVFFFMEDSIVQGKREIKQFASRGQQRLVILQLKLLQVLFIEQRLKVRPMLMLDDIFSELDSQHIDLVMEITQKQQTIITTTHEEFLTTSLLKQMDVVELQLR